MVGCCQVSVREEELRKSNSGTPTPEGAVCVCVCVGGGEREKSFLHQLMPS